MNSEWVAVAGKFCAAGKPLTAEIDFVVWESR